MDAASFDALVDEHYRSIYRFAYGSLRDHDAAENVCQEVFVKAWRNRQADREPDRIVPWLYRVARNTVVDAIRSRRKVRLVSDEELEGQRPVRDVDTPSDADVTRDRVWAALARLPEDTRAVVVFRVMQGMTNAAVACLLGISEASASRRLADGLFALQSILSGHHPEMRDTGGRHG